MIGRQRKLKTKIVKRTRAQSHIAMRLRLAFLALLSAVAVPHVNAQTSTYPAGLYPVAIASGGTNIWVGKSTPATVQ